RIWDIGGGGGLGRIGVKIWLADVDVRIVDCVEKGIRFVNELGKGLNLEDSSFYDDGGETFGEGKEKGERYDLVTGRAVARFSA
ncbi:RsmG family class I SAM-dependent methyltransferase, partial [Bacillus pumilus]|uniref:RsmG family class I SAM-dependent methyltransferase n=1 Tax=Bacillus pumilus TaxID=1408 RepID=UPI0016436471